MFLIYRGLDSANHGLRPLESAGDEQTLPGNHMRKISLTIGAIALLAACGVISPAGSADGAQEAQQVNAQLPMLQDATINGYVNSLGNRIAEPTSRADLHWQFAVVNTDVINAFALPGGFVYVNRGVLERASNESELAGVLGHEIEHVVRRHSVKQMEQAQGRQRRRRASPARSPASAEAVSRRPQSRSAARRYSPSSAAPTKCRPTKAASTT